MTSPLLSNKQVTGQATPQRLCSRPVQTGKEPQTQRSPRRPPTAEPPLSVAQPSWPSGSVVKCQRMTSQNNCTTVLVVCLSEGQTTAATSALDCAPACLCFTVRQHSATTSPQLEHDFKDHEDLDAKHAPAVAPHYIVTDPVQGSADCQST